MVKPSVSAMFVGFYKNADILEYDCPLCGQEHTLFIDEYLALPAKVKAQCKRGHVIIQTVLALTPCDSETEDE